MAVDDPEEDPYKAWLPPSLHPHFLPRIKGFPNENLPHIGCGDGPWRWTGLHSRATEETRAVCFRQHLLLRCFCSFFPWGRPGKQSSCLGAVHDWSWSTEPKPCWSLQMLTFNRAKSPLFPWWILCGIFWLSNDPKKARSDWSQSNSVIKCGCACGLNCYLGSGAFDFAIPSTFFTCLLKNKEEGVCHQGDTNVGAFGDMGSEECLSYYLAATFLPQQSTASCGHV